MPEKQKFSAPDGCDTNFIIISDEEDGMIPLYGHAVAMEMQVSGKEKQNVRVIGGIPYEAYITYLHLRFPNCKEVQEAWRSMVGPDRTTRFELLETIDDRIKLTWADVQNIQRMLNMK